MGDVCIHILTDDGGCQNAVGLHHIPSKGDFFSYYTAIDKKYLSDSADLEIEGEVVAVDFSHEFRRWKPPEGGHPEFAEVTHATLFIKRMTRQDWIKSRNLWDEE